MAYPTKIATCCYCGSRAALVLGKDRHELTCATCGAPLHDMKRLRQAPQQARPEQRSYAQKPQKKKKKQKAGYYAEPRKRRYKKRKGVMRHILEEAFDVIEDIFD